MSYNLLLTFELIWTVNVLELSRALGLFSVHCNVKVNCVFELSREKKHKKHEKKDKEKKKRKEYQKRKRERKVRRMEGIIRQLVIVVCIV